MRTVCYWLSLGLIFTIPWENLVNVGGLGTVARAVGLLLAAVWVFAVVVSGKIRTPRWFHVVVYSFILWNVLSVLWTIDLPMTLDSLLTYLQLGGLVAILWDLCTTRKTIRGALQAYVLGAYVSIGSLILNFVTGNPLAQHAGRYTAPGFDENELAGILCLGIPIAWYLVLPVDDKPGPIPFRVINYLYIPASVLAILLTASRTALLGLIPAAYFVLRTISHMKHPGRIAAFGGLALAFMFLLPHVPESTIERLSTIQTEATEGDINGRAVIWREAMRVFHDHALFGVGSAAFRPAVGIQKVAHNFIFSVLVELGLVGFGLFSLVLFSVVQEVRAQPREEARFWGSVMLVWFVFALALPLERRKPTWLVFDLVVIAASLPHRRELEVREAILSPGPTRWSTASYSPSEPGL
jgi:O-antigen ligase